MTRLAKAAIKKADQEYEKDGIKRVVLLQPFINAGMRMQKYLVVKIFDMEKYPELGDLVVIYEGGPTI